MRIPAFGPMAAILGVLVLLASTVNAGPIVFRDVIQVASTNQNSPELRLRSLSQDQEPNSKVTSFTSSNIIGSSVPAGSQTLLEGVAINSSDSKVGVDVVSGGDVEGTVCDCGDISVAGGGFPKWPFLFLAAVPLAFINHCETCNESTPLPTPLPKVITNRVPETPVPEPASLLLLGSGLVALGAGLRRSLTKKKLEATVQEG